MPSRLAIIPARGGSKRIPDKNIRDFCGRPMIGHILQAAAASKLFDTIHVSTESQRIADVVLALGYPIDFLRPDRLADDHTPLMPVLRYVTEAYAAKGRVYDEIWLLMACASLIEPDDLIGASRSFTLSGGQRPVMTVAQYPAPVEWAFRREEGNHLVPLRPEMLAVRSQDIEPTYFDTGSFYVYPTSAILQSEGAGDYSAYVAYLLPRQKAIDIDSEEDLQLAESMFLARARSGSVQAEAASPATHPK
jgi:pseudaminic acid cytidylyltransferase